MLKKIGTVVVGILVVLGVLFIILMLIPDEEEDDTEAASQQVTVSAEADQNEPEETDEADNADDTDNAYINPLLNDEPGEGFAQNVVGNDGSEDSGNTAASDTPGDSTSNVASTEPVTNAATVNIPDSALSSNTIRFKTVSLDDKEITQDIFSDYDLTIVHVWGTYCQPCISEMGDYAQLYKGLPDNVNLIAIVCDVYDGINNNVSSANRILSDAGAEFTNLRVSDDVYNLISGLQYIPSSFFVDREGHMVGELLSGATYSETVAQLNKYLE